MVPPLQEREADIADASAEAAPDADRSLRAVLSDLRACREALAGLRPGPDEEA